MTTTIRNWETRSDEAFDRLEKRYERTPAEQLAELDRRLGAGIGARKERAALAAQIGDAQ